MYRSYRLTWFVLGKGEWEMQLLTFLKQELTIISLWSFSMGEKQILIITEYYQVLLGF